MNGYIKRTKQKKDAIIKASLQLFNLKGYKNTTIKDIADSAQVSQVSIYNYFGNKEKLICECAKYLLQKTVEQAEQILTLPISYIEKLQQVFAICNEDSTNIMKYILSDIAMSDPTFVASLKKDFSEIKESIYRKYIELGKSESIISPTLSTEVLLDFINSLDNIGLSKEITHEDSLAIHHLLLYGLIGSPRL